jgi:hypothetical protein
LKAEFRSGADTVTPEHAAQSKSRSVVTSTMRTAYSTPPSTLSPIRPGGQFNERSGNL